MTVSESSRNTARDIVFRFLRKVLLRPFSDKVTRLLIYIGGALLAFPSLTYIVLDLLANKLFGVSLGVTYPTREVLTAGVIVLLLAIIHNLVIHTISAARGRIDFETPSAKISGNFSLQQLQELTRNVPGTASSGHSYADLREKYQPKLFEAVHLINVGELDKGREILRSIMRELPLGILGSVYLNYGYLESSSGNQADESYYLAALRIFEDIKYKQGLAAIYGNMGEAARLKHEFQKAEECQRKAILISEELGDELGQANAISSLGLVFAQQCKHEKAEELFNQSIDIYNRRGAASQVRRVKSYIDTLRSCPNYRGLRG